MLVVVVVFVAAVSAAVSKPLQKRNFREYKLFSMAERCILRCEIIFGNWKLFKNDEKYFLFHLKSSFRSQDI